MTELEFLEDTIKYYSEDTSRRATKIIDNHPFCVYRSEDGRKCAIGRWILDEDYSRSLEENNASTLKSREVLPEWLSKFDGEFLDEVQALHDGNQYWDYDGLTRQGKKRVILIMEIYKLGIYA